MRTGLIPIVEKLLPVLAVVVMGILFTAYLKSDDLAADAFSGLSIEILNQKFESHRSYDPARRDVGYFQDLVKAMLFRLNILTLLGFVLLYLSIKNQRLHRYVTNFFREKQGPLTLSIFRIGLFGILLVVTYSTPSIFFAGFSSDLIVSPFLWGLLAPYLPITPELAELSRVLLAIFCMLGVLGFYSRTVAALAALCAIYYLGIPQFFGKVNHDSHHLVWFLMILSVSPCGDALSLDSLLRARKKGSRWFVLPPPSARYALPIRFIWLLIGVIYFFPGIWKFLTSGIDWFTTDSLVDWMYYKWHTYGDWQPFLRIDRFPLLAKIGAFLTIIFETSFLFTLFVPRLRSAMVAAALCFHLLTGVFMDIWFFALWSLYFVFFDLDAIWEKVRAFFKMSKRPPVVYDAKPYNAAPLIAVGASLVLINFTFGLSRVTDAWPFGAYPLFATVGPTTNRELYFEGVFPGGQIKGLDIGKMRQRMGRVRLEYLVNNIVATRDISAARIKVARFIQIWAQEAPEVRHSNSIRIYDVTYSLKPGEKHRNPIAKSLLLEFKTDEITDQERRKY